MVKSDEDYTEDEEMILSLILQDDSQPEAESRPSAQFYRCTKVLAKLTNHFVGLSIFGLKQPSSFGSFYESKRNYFDRGNFFF